MNHILSYETALRLKKAGFPQNEMAPGQMWWTGKDGVSVDLSVATLWPSVGIQLIPLRDPADGLITEYLVYAPDAPSILNELRDATITYVHLTPVELLTAERPHTPRPMFRAEAQIVNTTGPGFNPNLTKVILFEHENAAETVAAVWLAIHENAAS